MYKTVYYMNLMAGPWPPINAVASSIFLILKNEGRN